MFTDGVEILEDYRPVYDIIFLDVKMQHLDGMETARRIRELDSDVLLIFITNMAQYAIKGYAVGALRCTYPASCSRTAASSSTIAMRVIRSASPSVFSLV